MSAHKYSYGIPEARKTFIPAEAHTCSALLSRPLVCAQFRQFLGRANGREKPTWDYEFSRGPSRMAPHGNANLPSRTPSAGSHLPAELFSRSLARSRRDLRRNDGSMEQRVLFRPPPSPPPPDRRKRSIAVVSAMR